MPAAEPLDELPEACRLPGKLKDSALEPRLYSEREYAEMEDTVEKMKRRGIVLYDP
jgi:hypothetical protein